MYTVLVNDTLTEYSYDAWLAGLRYDYGSYNRGVFLAHPNIMKRSVSKLQNMSHESQLSSTEVREVLSD